MEGDLPEPKLPLP